MHIEPLVAHWAPGSLYRDTVHVEPLVAHWAPGSLYRATVHIEPVLECDTKMYHIWHKWAIKNVPFLVHEHTWPICRINVLRTVLII